MSSQKFAADNIFTGTTMLPADNVLITDGNGIVQDILPISEAGDDIQYHPGILSPGFINCHCHLELSHMKGLIPEKTGLVDFVITVMQKRNFATDVILAGIENAEADMLANGIVAVGDICNTAFTLVQKQKGNLHYYNFIEASGFVPQFAEVRFKQTGETYKQLAIADCRLQIDDHHLANGNTSSSNLQSAIANPQSSIVPHAPYSTSLELMQLINNFSAGKVVTIHNQETKEEESFFINGESGFRKLFALFNIDIDFYKPHGKNSLQTYLPYLNKASNLILVHNTFTSKEDVAFINHQTSNVDDKTPISSTQLKTENYKLQTFFCLCPNANLYIENMLPDVEMLVKNNANIVLGTDSLASNHSLSVLDEIKTLHHHFSNISIEQLLQWGTLNGAKALQMDGILGSFEKGKKPGVICIDENFEEVKRLI